MLLAVRVSPSTSHQTTRDSEERGAISSPGLQRRRRRLSQRRCRDRRGRTDRDPVRRRRPRRQGLARRARHPQRFCPSTRPPSRPSGHTFVADLPQPETPNPEQALSFERHIKGLFRARDRGAMRFAFDLWSVADVRSHARAIQVRLREGTMPCDGAWPAERISIFERWIAEGCAD
jgi:hypothetical protein